MPPPIPVDVPQPHVPRRDLFLTHINIKFL